MCIGALALLLDHVVNDAFISFSTRWSSDTTIAQQENSF